LKSKIYEIRENSRKALIKVNNILGPYFLGHIIKEMKSYLNKGYSTHVLNYTIWAMLNDMFN